MTHFCCHFGLASADALATRTLNFSRAGPTVCFFFPWLAKCTGRSFGSYPIAIRTQKAEKNCRKILSAHDVRCGGRYRRVDADEEEHHGNYDDPEVNPGRQRFQSRCYGNRYSHRYIIDDRLLGDVVQILRHCFEGWREDVGRLNSKCGKGS